MNDALEPHRLCGYLYDLARTFTAFYDACPVLVVAVLAVFRLRRAAAVGAWLGTVGFVSVPLVDPDPSLRWLVWHAGSVLAGIVVSAALTWSPGPARGWELVGGKRFTLFAGVVVATVVLFAQAPGVSGSRESVLTSIGSVMLVGGAVMARWRLVPDRSPGSAGAGVPSRPVGGPAVGASARPDHRGADGDLVQRDGGRGTGGRRHAPVGSRPFGVSRSGSWRSCPTGVLGRARHASCRVTCSASLRTPFVPRRPGRRAGGAGRGCRWRVGRRPFAGR